MGSNSRNSVIDFVGVPWGTDFCKFYRVKADLIDLLVPYFKTGLENNELCIRSNPPDARKALIWALYGLIWAVPDLATILEVRDITESRWREDESGGMLKSCVQQARSWLASTAYDGKVWVIELKEGMNKPCFRSGEQFPCCIKSMVDDK